jgi:hypothetical protein
MEKMKLKLDLTFTLRLHLPEFFADWDPIRPELAAALACGYYGIIIFRKNTYNNDFYFKTVHSCQYQTMII